MRGAIPPLLQYVLVAWCLVKAQGKVTFFYLYQDTVLCGYEARWAHN